MLKANRITDPPTCGMTTTAPPTTDARTARAFLEESRRLLTEDHLPRIERCASLLSDDELWWRPSPGSNSVGNLVLHLAGNLRQWVVSGIGGEPDRRRRQAEFDERGPLPAGEALAALRSSVTDADRVLAAATPESLLREAAVQGLRVTGLTAVYHAVEHFSMHTGQIILLTKMRKGDLGFYDLTGGVPQRTWLR
jgi:uncharacterized damage-inducible protein DinB